MLNLDLLQKDVNLFGDFINRKLDSTSYTNVRGGEMRRVCVYVLGGGGGKERGWLIPSTGKGERL